MKQQPTNSKNEQGDEHQIEREIQYHKARKKSTTTAVTTRR